MWLVSKLQLFRLMGSSVLESSQMTIVLIAKMQFFVNTFPRLMEFWCLIFIDVVIVICFLNIITSFLFHNFMSLIIEHSLLSDSFDTITVFVSLLFLRDSLSIFVLSSSVLKVALCINFTIRSHCRTTYKCLADIRSFLSVFVSLLMH